MDTKAILSKGVQIITFIFAAFNDFFFNIAPPGDMNSSYAIGISSFLALFILLFISAISRNQPKKKYKKIWLAMSMIFFVIALIASGFYKSNFEKLTFVYNPEGETKRHIAGTTLTFEAKKYLEGNPLTTTSKLVADFGGIENLELVWTRDSVHKAKMMLTFNYILLILTIAAMIFCLTEGVFFQTKSKL